MRKYIAHRGIYNKNVKDNSYEALVAGLKSDKYIGIETDLRVTKDNIFILYHNVIYNGKLINKLNYNELKNICKLEDILKIKTDKIILIEIKDFNINIKRLIKILNKYKRNIMLMSFNSKVIKKIKEYTNKYKLGVLNYILNSDDEYEFDFICLLDAIASDYIINSFKKRNIKVIIYAVINANKNYTYIIDDYKLNKK